MQIILALFALSFLIVIHEFGHFIVAKLSGIKVLEFSLFMGPKLLSIQRGETLYSLRLIPLGGFVRMEGEEQESEDDRAFNKKPILTRAAVIAAGPLMNLMVAVVITSILFSVTGYVTSTIAEVSSTSPNYKVDIKPGDKVIGFNGKSVSHPMDVGLFMFASKEDTAKIDIQRGNEKLTRTVVLQKSYKLGFVPKADTGAESSVVSSVYKDSPAAKAGLMANDKIIKLNDRNIETRQDVHEYLNSNKDKTVIITVERQGVPKELKATKPSMEKEADIGFRYKGEKGNFIGAVKNSFTYSYSVVKSVFYSVIWLVTGTVSLSQMMGPVGIVTTIGDVVQQSPTIMDTIISLLGITAFISINLGVFNLIPFPALDGSKLLLLAIEGIRKKAIPPEKEALISMVGFVLLIMLMIFTTSNDLIRIFTGG